MQIAFQSRDLELRDGRTVHLREVRPTDEEEILQAFDRMGHDARYMRFMSARQHVNVERLRTVLASFPEKGFAIAAIVPAPDGIDIVGSASCILEPGGTRGEFAISITDAWGGAGLGRKMMETLIETARQRGLARMTGFVLAANAPMLALAKRVGFKAARDPEDFSVSVVTLALA